MKLPYHFRCAMDFVISACVVLLILPIAILALVAVYFEDRNSPLYKPRRVGLNGKHFGMLKIRTMIPDADKNKVDSTSLNDPRITKVGNIIRSIKLDEILQFVNVLLGSMSIVGPRPNVDREVALYTEKERLLLSIKPGISDLSSIVFSDLGEILENTNNPNLDYNQLIRPWKARLAMVYIEHGSTTMYFKIIWLTALNILNRQRALQGVVKILKQINASEELICVAARKNSLKPHPPLGAKLIVTSRIPI